MSITALKQRVTTTCGNCDKTFLIRLDKWQEVNTCKACLPTDDY